MSQTLVSTGQPSLSLSDYVLERERARRNAEKAVFQNLVPALRWLETQAGDEQPLWYLGYLMYPGLARATQTARAPVILHLLLANLGEHYALPTGR
jgi:hypothetical protein